MSGRQDKAKTRSAAVWLVAAALALAAVAACRLAVHRVRSVRAIGRLTFERHIEYARAPRPSETKL